MGGFSYPKRGGGGAGINEVLNHSVFEVWGEFLYGVICITLGKSFSVGHRLHCAVGLLGLLPGPPDWVPKPPLVILPTWGTKASIHACGPYQSLFLRLLPTGWPCFHFLILWFLSECFDLKNHEYLPLDGSLGPQLSPQAQSTLVF